MERWTLMLCSVSPFHPVQVLAPGLVLPIQGGLSVLSYISLEAPSETCQEVHLLRVCQSSPADHEDGHHALHLCSGDSSKVYFILEPFGPKPASSFYRRASWGAAMHGILGNTQTET